MKKLFFIVLLVTCTNVLAAPEKEYWHVKCFQNGQTVNVKAILPNGYSLPVKAYRTGNILSVKAIEGKKIIPIKILKGTKISTYDVKAIKNNIKIPIKGITDQGSTLQVKAFKSNKGYNVVCLTDSGKKLPLKAISSNGVVYDIKGIHRSFFKEPELTIKIVAHVKGVKQNG